MMCLATSRQAAGDERPAQINLLSGSRLVIWPRLSVAAAGEEKSLLSLSKSVMMQYLGLYLNIISGREIGLWCGKKKWFKDRKIPQVKSDYPACFSLQLTGEGGAGVAMAAAGVGSIGRHREAGVWRWMKRWSKVVSLPEQKLEVRRRRCGAGGRAFHQSQQQQPPRWDVHLPPSPGLSRSRTNTRAHVFFELQGHWRAWGWKKKSLWTLQTRSEVAVKYKPARRWITNLCLSLCKWKK